MSFTDAFPEFNSAPPLLEGEHPPDQKYLVDNLRRQQLIDLAAAWNLEIDDNAPKHVMLIAMRRHEGAGTFRTDCPNPLMLQRASRRPDDRRLDRATEAGKTPEEVDRLDYLRCGGILRKEEDGPGTMKALRELAKAKGINTFGLGKAEIQAKLDALANPNVVESPVTPEAPETHGTA